MMNKETHTRNQKRMYRIHKLEEKIHNQDLLIGTLQQKLDKIVTYAKDRCDGYLEDLKEGHLDCEYCDGVFASCRKVLQLAGEDISEYE